MTGLENSLMQEEENYYQILSVPSTATLIEIRNAFEEKLEEAYLEAIAAYSLLPEVETEEKLLQYSQAFVALANPIARAKYDDEIKQLEIASKQPANQLDSASTTIAPHPGDPEREKTEAALLRIKSVKKQHEEKLEITKSAPKEVVGQTQEERQDFYLNLAVKNELSEDSLEEYYSKLRAHGGKVTFNGAVLKQIRELKLITLDELAKITCIRSTYLEAIEDEIFHKFPSEIYLKGYLICYVEAMNLSVEQIYEDYICLYKNYLEAKNG